MPIAQSDIDDALNIRIFYSKDVVTSLDDLKEVDVPTTPVAVTEIPDKEAFVRQMFMSAFEIVGKQLVEDGISLNTTGQIRDMLDAPNLIRLGYRRGKTMYMHAAIIFPNWVSLYYLKSAGVVQ